MNIAGSEAISNSIYYVAMLTQYSTAEKRQVYLASRTVFAGPNAQLRKHKRPWTRKGL